MNIENATFNPGPDGVIRVGNDLIQLKDETKKTFETDNMEAFESFLADKQEGSEIYYDAGHLYLVPAAVSKNSRPLAHCALQPSAELALLLAHAGEEMQITQFEKLLTTLRRNGEGVLNLLARLRSFVVAKKQTYDRAVDNAGNFKLVIMRESAVGDWEPPATLAFTVPVFTFLPETFTVDFDLVFGIRDEGTKPVFILQNLNLKEDLQERRQEVIEARLGKVATCPKYWGASRVHVLDDSWKYRENKADL